MTVLRGVGAGLVLVGMVGLAWQAVGRLSERVETLRSLQGAMAYLEEELAFRLTPLPKLVAHLAKTRQGGATGEFFQAVLAGLEQAEGAGFAQSWSGAAHSTLVMLKEEERQELAELGEVLGRYDAQTQIQALRLAGERLAGCYIRAQEERQRLGKVYLALGVAGGLMTVLVLI